ncbi:hypothetical protein [Variovorax sp. SG517]|uniref:hypothetical protein n=1 Tax=unclassified Variovorax TaxID=663243 RepID=UPI00159D1C9E|nr:hypothetical protein [Variovorax sp. SG517]NVM92470.1 hypothetical protein [Variovorax sp. SG517]
MTIDIFFDFLSKYLKEIDGVVRQKIEIEKSNSGLNRNSSSPYGFISFYPYEIDLIVSAEQRGECFEISVELMNQEGGDSESVWQFEGTLSVVLAEMEADFNFVIPMICNRLNKTRR